MSTTHQCGHPRPSASCYQNCRCRCQECRSSQSLYAKRRRLRVARGVEAYVDVGPARKHVERLMKLGMSHGTIALMAGMSNSGLQAILGLKTNASQVKRVRPETAERILKVRYANTVGSSLVDATGSRRRLQDLALRGFGARELGGICGVELHSLRVIRAGARQSVRVETEKAIRAMHEALEGTEPRRTSPGNSRALMAEARRLRYAPIASYDNIDNPRERAKGLTS